MTTPQITIELCTAGTYYGLVKARAEQIGVPVSTIKFYRQQDITVGGVQAFPRIWHKGQPDEVVLNGGEPGLHDHRLIEAALAQHAKEDAIFDLEPENWQDWFKGRDDRRIIDGFDVVESVSGRWEPGRASVAFCFYPEMYPHLRRALGDRFTGFMQAMPLPSIDGYLYDAKDRAAWTREEYGAMLDANLVTICLGIPSRRIAAWRWSGTSGEYRVNTMEEERMMSEEMLKRRLRRVLWWVPCDTHKQALESASLMTPERVAAMRGGAA